MAAGIGEFFGGLARGTQAGIQLGQNQRRIDLAEETLDIKKDELAFEKQQLLAQMQDIKLYQDTLSGEQQVRQDESAVASLMKQGRFLATIDKEVRGPVVDQFAKSYKARFGEDLAEPFITTMKKADSETAMAMMAQIENNVMADPGSNLKKVSSTLSNPQAAAQAIGSANIQAQKANAMAEVGGAEKVKLSSQRKALQAKVAKKKKELQIWQQRAGGLTGANQKVAAKFAEKIAAIETDIDSLETKLTQDFRTRVDLNDRVQFIDSITGEVLDERMKNKDPSLTVFNEVDPETGQVLDTVTFDSKSGRTAPVRGPNGGMLIRSSVQAGSSEDLFGDRDSDDSAMAVVKNSADIAEVGILLQRIRDPEAPQLTGIRGALSAGPIGFLGQFSPDLAQNLASAINAASPEEQQEFLTSSTRLVGQSIEKFTGERSGRFTEPERNLTRETTALSKAIKSPQQAVGALKGIIKLGFLDREFNAFVTSGGSKYFTDVATNEGAAKLVRSALRNGLNESEALDLLNKVAIQQQELQASKDFFLGKPKDSDGTTE